MFDNGAGRKARPVSSLDSARARAPRPLVRVPDVLRPSRRADRLPRGPELARSAPLPRGGRSMRMFLAPLSGAALLPGPAAPAQAAPPPIKNVFVIVLENENYDTTFGKDSKAPYLSKTLVSKG